jgi:hypothetical protein
MLMTISLLMFLTSIYLIGYTLCVVVGLFNDA